MAFNKNKVMDAARKFVERGQVDRAIKEYLRVVQEDPKDVRVWLKVGDLYAKKGAKQEATETYLKVAKFYSEQGFYLKAVAVYKQILKLDARLVEVNLKLAELYRQLGLMSDAMQHFEMVAAHFHREGKNKEALATVRQLVNLDPENVATRIKLAELYSKEGMVEEAVTEFGAACDYLRAHNRQDDFIKVAERLIWHKPDANELNRELATLYLRRNDPRRALQKLQACFKADARDVETLALLAQAFQALDQKGKTVSVLKELARVLDEDGKKEQAADVHRKILMYVPDEADSRAYLGEAAPAPAPVSAPAASRDREFAITSSDLPSPVPRKLGKATGSMPLVKADDERPFSDPELIIEADDDDEEDFAADFDMEESSPRFDTGSAQGEMHAEEIIKILTETDVYVKYGLHQKAIDHLKRVFDLDPGNVEARERLKEIYVSQGREADAIEELLHLAEMAAPTDADRAEQYLREILAMDGTCAAAHELARRHRLDLAGGPDVEIIEDYSDAIELDPDSLESGAIAAVNDDDMEFEMDFGESGEVVASDIPSLEDEDDGFEFAALAEQSEAEYEFEIDDSMVVETPATPGGSVVTQEVSLDQVEGIVALEEEEDDFGFDADLPVEPVAAGDAMSAQPPVAEPPAADPFAALPGFDPDDAAAFDADIDAAEAHALSAEPMADVGLLESDFGGGESEVYRDEAGTALSPPQFLADEPAPVPADETVNSKMDNSDGTFGDQGGGTALEDDLDEADFFVSQGLYGEARDILHTLLGRYPNHPLVTAKLQDVEAMHAAAGGAVGDTPAPETFGDLPAEPADPGISLLEEVDEQAVVEERPAVLLERPVADEDADTHYDLGLAYKEMGLYGEAIKAFEKVIQHDARLAQSYLMIGMCHREQSNLSEAIHQFKQGLHDQTITDREKQTIYYEIGQTYEAIGDAPEAVYYYEMVMKKDPAYRDVSDRVTSIKGAMGRNGDARRGGPAPEDTDAAIESLLADSDSRSGRH